tara:strand:+ start:1721 stop:2209 length:489 start_codon:yes stop_codon:yes gene_type:complete
MAVSEQDKNFNLQDSADRGSGVFTKNFYSKGQIVMTGVMDKVVSINHVGVSQIGEHEYVAPVGLMALVNHSCNPNCGIKVNEEGAHDYVAMRDIEPGEEVTFDYAMQNYKIGYFPGKCLCGSSECRGTVGGWVDLPKDKRQHYEGYVAPYLHELDNKNSTSS